MAQPQVMAASAVTQEALKTEALPLRQTVRAAAVEEIHLVAELLAEQAIAGALVMLDRAAAAAGLQRQEPQAQLVMAGLAAPEQRIQFQEAP